VLGLETAPDLLFNCTGLGSLSLEDVKDESMYPTRGQLCVIRAPWIKYGKTFTAKGSTSYTIPRSSGLVIVGGTREAGDW
jgi:D-amino-acid oxidase